MFMLRHFKDALIEWIGTAVFFVVFVTCALIDKMFDIWNGNLWSDEE